MRLGQARVRNYRVVRDSGTFDIERDKTIVVGPNEVGKTAILRGLQSINPSGADLDMNALRDYPRSQYGNIASGLLDPDNIVVAEAAFDLDTSDLAALRGIDQHVFAEAETLVVTRYLSGRVEWSLPEVRASALMKDIGKDLARLRFHIAGRSEGKEFAASLDEVIGETHDVAPVTEALAAALDTWLEGALPLMEEGNVQADQQFDRVRAEVRRNRTYARAWDVLEDRVPVFVYFSQYHSVRGRINLTSLAQREASGELDQNYDFGNVCLLQLLGFTAKELGEFAEGAPSAETYDVHDPEAVSAHRMLWDDYQDQLDDRKYRLNAASVDLTRMIRRVWGDDNVTLRFDVDGQYLKVVVVDDLGVEVELDQRSDGFRWLVSFFIVFRAQARDQLQNSILLLDEPGLSLHPLKQQEFRRTVSLLAMDNQVLYTTHSPFMIGVDELAKVRIVELRDRESGTEVHTTATSADPRSLYPLRAALGYDLAQTLFGHGRSLITERLTDMWLLDGVIAAMRADGVDTLHESIAVVPAPGVGAVMYCHSVLPGQDLPVVALLDDDRNSPRAAAQDELVRLLPPGGILRSKEHYVGQVEAPTLEDLLRETLVKAAFDELHWDVVAAATTAPHRRILDVFAAEVGEEFNRYRLAKAFLTWLSRHGWTDLKTGERRAWQSLFAAVNERLG